MMSRWMVNSQSIGYRFEIEIEMPWEIVGTYCEENKMNYIHTTSAINIGAH